MSNKSKENNHFPFNKTEIIKLLEFISNNNYSISHKKYCGHLIFDPNYDEFLFFYAHLIKVKDIKSIVLNANKHYAIITLNKGV